MNAQLLQNSNDNFFDSLNINIIDFGFATPYIDLKSKVHLDKIQLDIFRGNMEFSSLNQMKFFSTSRRDDLIQLFYLLIYILKRGQMPGFDGCTDDQITSDFGKIFELKSTQKTKDLCFGNTKEFSKFKREIFSYRFQDTPDYTLLRRLLENARDSIQREEGGI